MRRARRARDYTAARHIVEQLALRAFGGGRVARWHARAGLHRPPVVWEERVRLPHPRPAPPPLRVAFASDFHAGPMTRTEVLAEACAALAALAPDLLLLGGDYVSWDGRFVEDLAPLLEAVPAPLGRLAVVGNHDLWADDVPIRRRLSRAGVRVLVNEEARLPPPYDRVAVYGMDDPTAGEPLPPGPLAGAGDVRLLLAHSPEGLAHAPPGSYHLALAGHTHGGQVALPGGRQILLAPGSLSARYPAGRLTIEGGAEILVSRGVGYGDMPVRWNAPADVLVATLEWEEA